MSTASKAVAEQSAGIIKAKDKDIIQGWDVSNEISLAPKIRKVLMRNNGANAIKVHFNDDLASNFWTIMPGEQLPCPIDVVAGTVIKCAGQGGDSVLQYIIWG